MPKKKSQKEKMMMKRRQMRKIKKNGKGMMMKMPSGMNMGSEAMMVRGY